MTTSIPKVLCYVTWQRQLLVFSQPDRPEQGVQVPGGSVEEGEALSLAALREAREETGLCELSVESYLGFAHYELKVDIGPPHLRHYFHLSCSPREPGPLRWQHVEPPTPSRPYARRVELWWEPLDRPRLRLDWEQDRYLDALRSRADIC